MEITMQKQDITLLQALDNFIIKCKVKNLSSATIEAYDIKNKNFLKWYGDNLVKDITEETIDNYTLYLKQTDISDITVVSYLRHLRALLYYCMDYNYLKRFKVKLPKANKPIKEIYSDEELQILLKKPDINKCTFTTYKVWVLENYLLATGNRLSTAINLKIKDIDFSDSLIVLSKTKNRKQQIIPMSNTLSNILFEYLSFRKGDLEDYLFCNIYGQQTNINTTEQNVKTYNRSRGISKTSCHLFRHTFAKKWILAGGDIFRLQKMLGHSDLTVTKEYVNMFSADLCVDFNKFNPDWTNVNKVDKKIIVKRINFHTL